VSAGVIPAGLEGAALAAALRECCGIDRWVDGVLARQPFRDEAALLSAADAVFAELAPEDWRRGFAAVGEPPVARDGETGTQTAAELALRLYRERFGYPFITSAPPMASDELLMRIRIRLGNEEQAEFRGSSAELRRLTHYRLSRLMQRGG
jgi:2-oxo-4-hydroxy-4-carboxy-5-ureidoimidazoline decarboxylase